MLAMNLRSVDHIALFHDLLHTLLHQFYMHVCYH